MGSCLVVKKGSALEKYIGHKLTNAIERGAIEDIREIITKYTVATVHKDPALEINTAIIKIYDHDMNALGYSLFLGQTQAFITILEFGRAKLSSMCKLFIAMGKWPIEIICELGHKELLDFYLPFYLSKSDELNESVGEMDEASFRKKKIRDMALDENGKTLAPAAPLHRACEKGRLNVVQYIFNYFRERETPNEFDIHYQDELTGDNCALVSCKTGMLEMLQYLYEVCRADFHIFNKRKENALQVLAVWSKKRKQRKYIDSFRYLIETVCVDYTYEYEETLLILEDQDIIKYLEDKLRTDMISIDKSRIDDLYSINRNRVPAVMEPALEAKLNKMEGKNFNFGDLFDRQELEEEEELSSIQSVSNQDMSNLTILDFKLSQSKN